MDAVRALTSKTADIERTYLEAYDMFSQELFRRSYMSLRDKDAAHDVVQETFTRAWEYLRKGNEIAYFRAFLYRVANNLIVDVVRKRRTSSLDALVEDKGFEIEDESIVPAEQNTRVREMTAHLKDLEDKYRSIVKMRYLEEQSPRAIAQSLGVSENVVSVRLYRGLRQLSKLMEAAPAR